MRLAGFVFALYTLQYLFSMYHAPNANEAGLIIDALGEALWRAVAVWILYLASSLSCADGGRRPSSPGAASWPASCAIRWWAGTS